MPKPSPIGKLAKPVFRELFYEEDRHLSRLERISKLLRRGDAESLATAREYVSRARDDTHRRMKIVRLMADGDIHQANRLAILVQNRRIRREYEKARAFFGPVKGRRKDEKKT